MNDDYTIFELWIESNARFGPGRENAHNKSCRIECIHFTLGANKKINSYAIIGFIFIDAANGVFQIFTRFISCIIAQFLDFSLSLPFYYRDICCKSYIDNLFNGEKFYDGKH